MLHVLIGEDDYSVRQALEEIKGRAGDSSALMSNTTLLEGRQVTPEQMRNACETVPFLADKRLVIIEGLLERFDGGGKKKAPRQAAPPEDLQQIADILKRLPEFTEVVILGGKSKATNPLLRALGGAVKVRLFPYLKAQQVRQWIERRVKAAGGSISTQAVTLLERFVGNDLWIMSGEVDKLLLYTAGKRIEESDVRELVSYAQEGSVFNMVDAIVESRAGRAQELLEHLLRHGQHPAQLLVMLARQVRLMLQVKDMRARRLSREEIKGRLGITSDFVMSKAWEQADRYTPEQLRSVYHRLLDADVSIKTGRYDGELALNVLIAELARPGAATAR